MVEALLEHVKLYGPRAAFFLAIVIGGWVISMLARRITRWLVDSSGLDALAERAGAAKLLHAIGYRRGVSQVAGTVVYAVGLVVTAAAAAQSIGLTAVADGAAVIVGFVPKLLAALIIIGAGAAVASVLRRLATGFASRRPDVERPEALGNLAYYAVMTIVVVVAAGQAGIETHLIEMLMVAVASVLVAAIALAFALGSRASFHNLVAGHFFKRLARPGDTVRVGEHEGVIVRYFGVCVVIRTRDGGELCVPCKVLLDQTVGLTRMGAKARAAAAGEQVPPAVPAPPTA